MNINEYRCYKGAWIFLEESKEAFLSKEEGKSLLKKGGLMVRNIYDFDCEEETSFWFVIKDNIEDISELPFSARRNIRRSLRLYNIRKVDLEDFSKVAFPIISSAQKSYKVGCRVMDRKEYDDMIGKYRNDGDKDFWIVERKDTKEVVAVSINRIKTDSCEYDDMKCLPEALKDRSYPYYGLIFTMNRYYLLEKNMKYVSDGSRSVSEHSNIQDFLMHNFGFRKAYCKLNIYRKLWLFVVIKVLFPFRNMLPIGKIRSVLRMEEYFCQF